MDLLIENWGETDYQQAWNRQTEYFNHLIDAKLHGREYHNTLILCSHPHVYTLGKHGKSSNMLLTPQQLQRIGATIYHIDRGGDITYHGPGQIVCYPIINLEDFHLGLKEYIHLLEEAVIRVCKGMGIQCTRVDGATGVWLDKDTPDERKICAIGVRSSHYITMHGLAFNVNTNLDYFNYIHPCGFVDKGVTSLSRELGREVDLKLIEQQLIDSIISLLSK